MVLLIPFVTPLAEEGRAVLRGLQLPVLARLLARLQPAADAAASAAEGAADELSLSTPHERALARAWGWSGADGALPFAARLAAADGIDPGELAWGLLTPAHWALGTDQVSLLDPDALVLDAGESQALCDAVRPLFSDEGQLLRWGAPLRWYLAHGSLSGLATASPDRVIGRNVDRWLPSGAAAARLRRLQSEVQMLLYTHPLNAAREARGLPTVNSFWLSGCGVAQPVREDLPLTVDGRLRAPALAGDWAAWAAAWQALDAGPLAELATRAGDGEPVALILAGERAARRFETAPRGLWRRLTAGLQRSDPLALLETL